MKFMMANVGPTLSTILKVSKFIRPPLKATIAKAFRETHTHKPNNYNTSENEGISSLRRTISKQTRANLEHYGQKDPQTMKTSIQVKKRPMLNESAFSSLQAKSRSKN